MNDHPNRPNHAREILPSRSDRDDTEAAASLRLVLRRTDCTPNHTYGTLTTNGHAWCYTEESPTRRLAGPGEVMCLPHGVYLLLLAWEPRYQQDLPQLCGPAADDGRRIHDGRLAIDMAGSIRIGEHFDGRHVSGGRYTLNSIIDRLITLGSGEHATITITGA